MTQIQNDLDYGEHTIERLKKGQLKLPLLPDVPIHIYSGPKKPAMPENEPRRTVLVLKVLVVAKHSTAQS